MDKNSVFGTKFDVIDKRRENFPRNREILMISQENIMF
ncbi:MAG: hypothetical protein CM1200mP28_14300 [Deltaproteobacteria bacterium]|nr:MAG: hypothetical protein CM1200mP28_14300 [Deltaproteobacteria bacterium]